MGHEPQVGPEGPDTVVDGCTAVDESGEESFPASDPPARWAGPDRPPGPRTVWDLPAAGPAADGEPPSR
jgi:hypothetical protein